MKIFIGCGSNENIDNIYLEETSKVCNYLVSKDYELVYGAYNKGMMEVCYNTFKENNKNIIGVNINAYDKVLENEVRLENSFDRLKYIYKICDVFLILPGGTGTYSELLGILEENKTSIDKKKIVIYNYHHFYDKLLEFINDKKEEGFIYDSFSDLKIVNNLEEMEKEI